MTKAEVISIVADKTGLDKVSVSVALEGFFDAVKDSLAEGEAIYVRGFGSFVNKKRAAKKARNISKNITVEVPEHFIPSFKPSKEFSEQVKSSIK